MKATCKLPFNIMKNITRKHLSFLPKILAITLTLLGWLDSTGSAALVGQWTFELGEELKDRTGNFPNLLLKGNAQVADGKLDVNGAGTSASGWAVTDSDTGAYLGPVITNKTLVSWVALQSLGDVAKAGSVITLDKVSGDQFDGIIYGERQDNRWMNGSSFFSRTQDLEPGFEEMAVGELIQMAITYHYLPDGTFRVIAYRNRVEIGRYEPATPSQWDPGDAEVFFGQRHGSTSGGPGGLDALIAEARIYDTALSAAEIAALAPAGFVDSDMDGLRDDWETENFGNLAQAAAGDPDGDGVTNLDELRRGTDPKKADTDGDGLTDKVETRTGKFVDAKDTGTDPKKTDTDGDGLRDDVETNTGVFVSAGNTGTNPNRVDTDGDRLNDGAEVAAGTNPTDPKDPPTSLADYLVGRWTFEPGNELVDQTGNFPKLVLKGNAAVKDGKLDVNGAGTTASGWAVTDSGAGKYSGPVITNKTLVVWVTLQSLDAVAKAASAMTLDKVSADQFDGIIFSERQHNRWMNGSSGWQRTQDFDPGVEETAVGKLTQIAIAYEHLDGGKLRVTGYRNGGQIGQYETGNASRWNPGDAEVFFGLRHGSLATGGPGALDALIEEAAIYRVALTSGQINLLYNLGPEVGGAPLIGHWTFEPTQELIDLTGNFPNLLLKGNAKVSKGQLDINGAGTTATGWAVTDSTTSKYSGPLIESKTLVAWVKLQALSDVAKAASAITLDRVSGDQFDGIIFAEREDNRWMNGSSGWQRTTSFDPGFEETAPGGLINLAITYESVEGSLKVTGYRNGEPIGQGDGFPPSSWTTGDAEVFFGVRHGSTSGGPGALDALIDEARIYGGALSAERIKEIYVKGPILSEDRDGDGLSDVWELANFGNLNETSNGDPDADGLSNLQEFQRTTNPKNADTDNDGLKDGVETKTGQFVSAADSGTDPLVADSDGDGLKDGVENPKLPYDPARPQQQSGTDPNKIDSDGDGLSDGAEVAGKTDPTNPLDPPRSPISTFLVGHWTFESGKELVDLTGNFPPLLLMGDTTVTGGKLDVNGSGTSATGWAVTDSDTGAYKGPAISNKTLVVWATMQGLIDVARAGSLMTLDRVKKDQFDGIIFAERQDNRWMNGSSGFERTADFSPGFAETAVGNPIQVAVTYQHLGGGRLRVAGYRNGEPIGQYESGNPSSWGAGDAEVFFGQRHGSTTGGPGGLDALIEEARLYSEALTASEIRELYAPTPPQLSLSVTRVANKVRIQWTDPAARLESLDKITGTWSAVPNATSPFEQDTTATAMRFYRLKK